MFEPMINKKTRLDKINLIILRCFLTTNFNI